MTTPTRGGIRAGRVVDLTPRERDVLRLLAQGRSNRGIAEFLVLNDKTVETHVTHIFRKLDLDTDGQDRRVVAALHWHAQGQDGLDADRGGRL